MWQLVACCLRLAACSLTLANLVKKFLAAFKIASRKRSVILKEPRCKIVVFNSSLHYSSSISSTSYLTEPMSKPSKAFHAAASSSSAFT
jgi:hypothetical protein